MQIWYEIAILAGVAVASFVAGALVMRNNYASFQATFKKVRSDQQWLKDQVDRLTVLVEGELTDEKLASIKQILGVK